MFEMPSTMVRKMIGPITIFTSFTNVSPIGLRARPRGGSSAPTSAPRATAHRTWKVRLRKRRFIASGRRSRIPREQQGCAEGEEHAEVQRAEEEAERPEGPARDVAGPEIDGRGPGRVRRE